MKVFWLYIHEPLHEWRFPDIATRKQHDFVDGKCDAPDGNAQLALFITLFTFFFSVGYAIMTSIDLNLMR